MVFEIFLREESFLHQNKAGLTLPMQVQVVMPITKGLP